MGKMKKSQPVKPFYFKDISSSDIINILNEQYPVKIQYNTDLIDRIHIRYPFITKTQISVIVKAVFESFRDLLILGKVLNFNSLFFDVKLSVFPYVKNGKLSPCLKIKVGTPQKNKKLITNT